MLSSFSRLCLFLRSSSFWGSPHVWGRLHFWGNLHSWGSLIFKVIFIFEVVLNTSILEHSWIPSNLQTLILAYCMLLWRNKLPFLTFCLLIYGLTYLLWHVFSWVDFTPKNLFSYSGSERLVAILYFEDSATPDTARLVLFP